MRFRALWLPLEENVPRLLPVTGDPLEYNETLRGMALIQRLNCVACHESSNPILQARLMVAPPPDLKKLAAGLKPGWLSQWPESSRTTQMSSRMPDMFSGAEQPEESARAIFQFLSSHKIAEPDNRTDNAPTLVAEGRHAYHTVGCVACHGPLESVEQVFVQSSPPGFAMGSYLKLVDLGSK